MYKTNSKHLVNQYGKWLGEHSWDYFTTITYKHTISPKSNYRIMDRLEQTLDKTMVNVKMFWIMEYSNYKSTHNHLLLQGDGVKYQVDKYLKKSNLVDSRFVKHKAYNSSKGASYYVSKYIGSDAIEYGLFNK
jgi:hypothetical protein|tara:strand:+ start:83 stop:481 length:399 start_codon:yes stop_codon:yes gene_type:complete